MSTSDDMWKGRWNQPRRMMASAIFRAVTRRIRACRAVIATHIITSNTRSPALPSLSCCDVSTAFYSASRYVDQYNGVPWRKQPNRNSHFAPDAHSTSMPMMP